MRDVDDEVRQIKKEIVESRGLIIKTKNLVNALGADIKSIAKISPLSELEALLVFWKLARAMHIHFVDEN